MPGAPEPPLGLTVLTLPEGSTANNISSVLGVAPISSSTIDGLLSAASSVSISVSNSTSATNGKLIICLGAFTPVSATPKITLSDSTNTYSITITTGSSARRIEFNDIPMTFLANFTIINETGSTLPAEGNYLYVVPV
jgi:hypothetical protein